MEKFCNEFNSLVSMANVLLLLGLCGLLIILIIFRCLWS